VNNDGRAVLVTEFQLHQRRGLWHDDRDGDVEILSVMCQRQRLVTRARRYHTAGLLLLDISYTHIKFHTFAVSKIAHQCLIALTRLFR